MQQISNNSFFQAVGSTIFESLWQFAVIWLVYLIISFIFKLPSKHKYRLAVAAEILGFLFFIGSLYSHLSSVHKTSIFPIDNFVSFLSTKNQFWIHYSNQLLPFIGIIYLTLIVLLLIKWVAGFQFGTRLRMQGLHAIDTKWKFFVETLTHKLGLNCRVDIFLSTMVTTPLTLGFWKPVILIPIACINNLDHEQMEAIILHELAHIKRHDYIINLLLSLSEIALFFNPFMHLLSNDIKQERENCCDDSVLQFQYSPAVYASALLSVAVPMTKTPLAMYASDKKQLLARIKRMLQSNEELKYNGKPLLMVCLAFLLFCGNELPNISGVVFPAKSQLVVGIEPNNILKQKIKPTYSIVPVSKKALRYHRQDSKIVRTPTLSFIEPVSLVSEENSPIGNKDQFEKYLTAGVDELLLTKNWEAISKFKEILPKVIDKLNQQNGIEYQIHHLKSKIELSEKICLLQQKLYELEEVTRYNSLAYVAKQNKEIPAIFVMPSNTNNLMVNNFNVEAKYDPKVNASKPDSGIQKNDRLIIIQLPANVNDTSTHQINAKGKVIKITRI